MQKTTSIRPPNTDLADCPNAIAGLGGLDNDHTRDHVKQAHALHVVDQLQIELEKFEEGLHPFASPVREKAIALLKIIRGAVSELTDPPSKDPFIGYTSKSVALLDSIIGQLSDLNLGLVGDVVRHTRGAGGSRLKHEENDTREMARVLLQCHHDRGDSLQVARRKVSAALKKMGKKHRGNDITTAILRSWWVNPPV